MSKIKKIGLIVFTVVVAISAVITFFVIQINDNLEYLLNYQIDNVDITNAVDGTYIGEYEVFPVKAVVEVTIASGEITSITILEHRSGQGGPAEVIVDDVVAAQTLDVDAIAGATYSSKVILLAIQDVLIQATD